MKKIFYTLLLLLCVGCNKIEAPREGDIIFQTVKNQRGTLLEHLSESPINHCGIVVVRDSNLYVLHADRNVTLTPLHNFIQHGEKVEYTLMRTKNKEIKIDYKKYMLADYDEQMQLGNHRYYSSELVYEIYKNDLGIELCTPRPVIEYNYQEIVGWLRHNKIKPDEQIVTPADIYNSKELKIYKTTKQEAQ